VRAAALSGLCLIELKNLPEAARVLNYAIGEQPDDVEAHRGLAIIAYDLGQLDEAVHQLEEVARLDAADARPHRLIGLIYKDMAQNEKAVAAYREALARGLRPQPKAEVSVELAEVQSRLFLFAEALETLEAASPVQAEPDPARDVVRAVCLRGLGRKRDAVEVLDRALASKATVDLYRVRGQVCLDDAQNTEAIRYLEQATALAPADYQAHYLLAQAYAGAGRTTESTKTSSRAEAIRKDMELLSKLSREAIDKPWDSVVRLQLAEVSDRLGQPQLAAMWRAAATACRRPNR
jgi:tetratricopeptide (TPR) repeat protein